MSAFVDTSVWYAAADRSDRSNGRAKQLLLTNGALVTSDHILVETWTLLRHRLHRGAAERFWDGLRSGVAQMESVTSADLEAAWAIGERYPDQDFSIIDRSSFAMMQRLGIRRVLSFDDDFAVFRYGRSRAQAFEVIR